MKNQTTNYEQARLMKMIKEGMEAIQRIQSNLDKVTEQLTQKEAA